MSFPRYPNYKDSGVEWLGVVPGHWEVKRLKRACDVFPSNVDKKSHEGETPVLLCNYTDVYYNEVIIAGMDFMAATASSDQIAKFTLCAGDTIITKDSETADDIAIAAYVPEDLPGVICGYHLSMVRPLSNTDGAFIKRIFDSIYAKSCFAVLANGLTRVGLGQYALDNVELAFPPLPEQTQIAAFLDRETAKIDELVAEQRRLMELLKEKRQAVISHAVTQGLNPHAPMKPSGIEWLGDVPGHWKAVPIKHLGRLKGGAGFPHDRQGVEGEELSFHKVNALAQADSDGFLAKSDNTIDRATAKELGAFVFPPDSIVFAKVGAALLLGRIRMLNQEACLDNNMMGLVIRENEFHVKFVRHSMNLVQFDLIANPGAVPSLNEGQIGDFRLPMPPLPEQTQIAAFLDSELAKFDTLTAEAQRAIDLLQERRTALISAAVTGQIDVRGLNASAPALPEASCV